MKFRKSDTSTHKNSVATMVRGYRDGAVYEYYKGFTIETLKVYDNGTLILNDESCRFADEKAVRAFVNSLFE